MEERNLNKSNSENQSSNLSNILIGILLIVIAFLAFNFFKAEPTNTNENAAVITTKQEQTTKEEAKTEESKDKDSAQKTTDKKNAKEYTVQKGDSLWKIAVRELNNGYLWTEIAKANDIDINNADKIEAGTVLQIPNVAGAKVDEASNKKDTTVSNRIYVVKKGDTLWSIAEHFYNDGFQWEKILNLKDNKIEFYTARDGHKYPLIEEGMVLVIPDVESN